MPYNIIRDHPQCPAGKPYGLVKQGDTKPTACHETRAQAMAQTIAIMQSEQTKGTSK